MQRLKPVALDGGKWLSIALVIGMLVACGKDKTAEGYIHNAEAFRTAGNIPAAIIDLKNALQKDPKNLKARILLGESYLDLSQGAAAEAEFLHAKQDGAPPLAIVLPLAEAKLAEGHPRMALAQAVPPAGASNHLKAGLLGVQARAYLALGQMDDANAALVKGHQDDPHSVAVLTTMVRYALAKDDLVTARTRLAEAEKAAPNDPNLVLLNGSIEFAAKDFKAAEKAYQRALAKQPWNFGARLSLAQAQIAADDLQGASATLTVLLKAAPRNPLANYFAAVVSYRKKDYATAQREDQQALSGTRDFAQAELLAGAISYALKDYDEANSYLAPYVFQHPQDAQARKLLSAIQLALGHPNEAAQTLAPLADKNVDDAQVLAMLGTAAAQRGDLASANRYLSQAVAKQPENAALRTQLGVTKVALGQTDLGINELEKAHEEDQTAVGPDVALFRTYLENKEYDKALALAEQLEKDRPTDPTGFNLAGIAYIGKGDSSAARAAFFKAVDLRPGDPSALRNLALLAIRDGNFGDAAKYYHEILKANPKDYGADVFLAQVQGRLGKQDEAEKTLRTVIQQSPDYVPAYVSLAAMLLVEHRNQPALDVVEPALAKNPLNPGLLEVAGRAHLALGQTNEAIASFKKMIEAAPQAGAGHLDLANAYIVSHDLDDALAEARKAVELDPKNEGAKKLLVAVLLAKKDDSKARTIVAEMVKQYPHDIQVADLDGVVALAQERYDDAIVAFRRALAIHDNPADHARLALAQMKAGHVKDAENSLKNEVAAHPDDLTSRMNLGNIYASQKRFSDAKAQYAAVLQQAPNNVIAENNLAWTLSQLNEPAEALKYARAAATAAPDSSDVLDTLGVVLLENKDVDEAVATLRKAQAKSPNNPSVQFHLAQALVSSDKKSEARTVLRKLLANDHPFTDKEQAQELLNELGG